ncbi:MAG: hypothetical protein Q9207_003629 [Kuettlingeria erythrocarpa]
MSSFASRMQRAADQLAPETEDFRVIGLGSCGSVFEIPGTEFAFKKGSSVENMWLDFNLTNKVHNAIQDTRTNIQRNFPHRAIPKTPLCHEFHLAEDDSFWSEEMLRRLPIDHRSRQPIFRVDRILPIPKPTRDALINIFFDDDEVEAAKMDSENNDCLIRVYLGERESTKQQMTPYDTLRNFPLRLNMIEDLELETEDLATEMALGLAILHWRARVDAMDTEFVLGSSATFDQEVQRGYAKPSAKPHNVESINFKRRELHLWMLDFDKATKIEFTEQDVKARLVPAFLGNDPYYPRAQVDAELWQEFCAAYLKASEVILENLAVEEGARGLPQLFMDEVLRVERQNEDWDEEEQIVFAD